MEAIEELGSIRLSYAHELADGAEGDFLNDVESVMINTETGWMVVISQELGEFHFSLDVIAAYNIHGVAIEYAGTNT